MSSKNLDFNLPSYHYPLQSYSQPYYLNKKLSIKLSFHYLNNFDFLSESKTYINCVFSIFY